MKVKFVCPNCNENLMKFGIKFCYNCGTSLEWTDIPSKTKNNGYTTLKNENPIPKDPKDLKIPLNNNNDKTKKEFWVNKKDERIGVVRTMRNGLKAKVIDYKNAKNITLRFENGKIRKNIEWSLFMKGGVSDVCNISKNTWRKKKKKTGSISKTNTAVNPHAKEEFDKAKNKHLGRVNMMSCGLLAEIIEYRGYSDITIKFEDGHERKTTVNAFNRGAVLNMPK